MATTNDVLERRSTRPATLKKACRILVPTDFSASADAALEYATFLAWRIGATIEILHVWDLHATTGSELQRALAAERSDKEAFLDALAADHRKTGVRIRSRLVFGEVAASIAHAANQGHVDLIVMGTRDRPPSSPSIKATVMRSVRCPVIHMRTMLPCDLGVHPPLDIASPGSETTMMPSSSRDRQPPFDAPRGARSLARGDVALRRSCFGLRPEDEASLDRIRFAVREDLPGLVACFYEHPIALSAFDAPPRRGALDALRACAACLPDHPRSRQRHRGVRRGRTRIALLHDGGRARPRVVHRRAREAVPANRRLLARALRRPGAAPAACWSRSSASSRSMRTSWCEGYLRADEPSPRAQARASSASRSVASCARSRAATA